MCAAGIVNTEQQLQQCLQVLANVHTDVQEYKQDAIQRIEAGFQQELQQLTDSYEQQVRAFQEVPCCDVQLLLRSVHLEAFPLHGVKKSHYSCR